jgi:hypothetical protein
MSNQYIQWLSGNRRGQVESVELMQDGQTSEDVVLLSDGGKISMSKIGKAFIILPATSAALNELDLNMMYPIESNEQRVNRKPIKKEHQEMMGMQVEEPIKQQPRKQVRSSFSSDLLSRSKKTKTRVSVDLIIEMPMIEFFDMINKTFDDDTVKEVIDLIVDTVDTQEMKQSIKNSIINFYQGKS